MKWTAIIPARANSKGLSEKNIRKLKGKPLYQYAVDAALLAGADRIIISTDIKEILSSQHDFGIELLERPASLCLDSTPMAPVIIHACESLELSGALVLLQPTSPLRTAVHINSGLDLYKKGDFTLVLSVTEADNFILKHGLIENGFFIPISNPEFCFTNRQELPSVVRPNGAIYIFNAHDFRVKGGFPADKIGALVMSRRESFDIDTIDDLKLCEDFLN